MKKKILATILSVFTLFSAISFSACEVTDVLFADYKEQIAQLQETINEKEEQIATLKQENENLQGKITELQEDFVLKLSMEKEVYAQEEFISVEVVLENHSGEDIEIFYKEGYNGFGVPISNTAIYPEIDPPSPGSVPITKKLVKEGESLCFTERVDKYFSPGYHELRYRAEFYLDERLTNFITVQSNKVEFKKLGFDLECKHNTEKDNQDFVLKISMEKEIYNYAERAPVEIVLENHSGEDIEIFYYGLWRFESDTICVFWTYEYPPYPTKKTLKDGESLRFTDYANSEFSAGRHVVKCRAVFYLDEACTNSVIVHSNELEFKIVN